MYAVAFHRTPLRCSLKSFPRFIGRSGANSTQNRSCFSDDGVCPGLPSLETKIAFEVRKGRKTGTSAQLRSFEALGEKGAHADAGFTGGSEGGSRVLKTFGALWKDLTTLRCHATPHASNGNPLWTPTNTLCCTTDSAVLNAGGPVTCLAWCPTPVAAAAAVQHLALYADASSHRRLLCKKLYQFDSVVQIWNCGVLNER